MFGLREHGVTVRTELLAGLTTYLTMAYIVVVNPSILAEAGIDHGAAFVATCIAAAIGSAAMGLMANLPLALAPGMGLNAYFTFTVVKGMGVPWQVALGAVFVSGVVFLIISVLRVREWLINAIPMSLKLGIGAGIGLFLGLIGMHEMGLVAGNPVTLVTLGDVDKTPTLLACLGFLIMAGLSARGMRGAILIGILVIAALGIPFGLTELHGVVSAPPSLAPTFLQLDIRGALSARCHYSRLDVLAGRCAGQCGHVDCHHAARGTDASRWNRAALAGGSAGGQWRCHHWLSAGDQHHDQLH